MRIAESGKIFKFQLFRFRTMVQIRLTWKTYARRFQKLDKIPKNFSDSCIASIETAKRTNKLRGGNFIDFKYWRFNKKYKINCGKRTQCWHSCSFHSFHWIWSFEITLIICRSLSWKSQLYTSFYGRRTELKSFGGN